MKLDLAAAASAAAEPEVVYEASSLRWGSLKSGRKQEEIWLRICPYIFDDKNALLDKYIRIAGWNFVEA